MLKCLTIQLEQKEPSFGCFKEVDYGEFEHELQVVFLNFEITH